MSASPDPSIPPPKLSTTEVANPRLARATYSSSKEKLCLPHPQLFRVPQLSPFFLVSSGRRLGQRDLTLWPMEVCLGHTWLLKGQVFFSLVFFAQQLLSLGSLCYIHHYFGFLSVTGWPPLFYGVSTQISLILYSSPSSRSIVVSYKVHTKSEV